MKNISELKDKTILFGWIILILFLMSLVWVLTQPLQKYNLLRTVNSVFISSGDSRRVREQSSVFAAKPAKPAKPALLGYWFSMHNSTDNMFVFAVFQDGILIPLGAVVSDDGIVNEIIPLGAHSVQVMEKIPASVLQIYVTRIEKAASSLGGAK